MGNYDEVFSSERGKGKISRETRKGISSYFMNNIESEQKEKIHEEKMAKNREIFGSNNPRIPIIREEGINDRINAIPYNPKKYIDTIEQNNYHEGFYVMGNRAVHGRLEQLSDEQLYKIGMNDYSSNVDARELPEAVKNNVSYTQGYMMASITVTPSKKGRR